MRGLPGLAAISLSLAIRAAQCLPERAECSPATLEALEAAYVAELRARCTNPRQCAFLAEIEARYAMKREAWVTCR